jgi:hypothetical protein
MKNVMKLGIVLLFAAVMMMACGSGDGSGPTPPSDQFTLTLASAGPNTMTLTSNFNCVDCPIYENGQPYLKITTISNTPYPFSVSPSKCYQSGGLFFLLGNIWSNILCAP